MVLGQARSAACVGILACQPTSLYWRRDESVVETCPISYENLSTDIARLWSETPSTFKRVWKATGMAAIGAKQTLS